MNTLHDKKTLAYIKDKILGKNSKHIIVNKRQKEERYMLSEVA